jgi:hypothetical protein
VLLTSAPKLHKLVPQSFSSVRLIVMLTEIGG